MAGQIDNRGTGNSGSMNVRASGAAAAPDFAAPLHTQATYRLLTTRGLAPAEAANLTAFLVGLRVHRIPWTIDQVNRALFLRQLYQADGWGDDERHA